MFHSTRHFLIDTTSKVMLANRSSLGPKLIGFLPGAFMQQGVVLINHKTHKSAPFKLAHNFVNDKDITSAWEFAPTPEALATNPGLAGWVVRIYNDTLEV